MLTSVGRSVGVREMLVVLVIAAAGLLLAGLAALTDWYQHPTAPHAPVIEIVTPGGVAGQP
jgi:hypothetical protein